MRLLKIVYCLSTRVRRRKEKAGTSPARIKLKESGLAATRSAQADQTQAQQGQSARLGHWEY